MNKIIFRDPNVTVFQSVLFQTNSTVIETEDVIMVIDPCWLPEEVIAIRDFVENIRRGRPLFLFFTHSDFDHIIGYKAFKPDKVFLSQAFAKNPAREDVLEQLYKFDEDYYIQRSYPLEYPTGDFVVFRDGVQYRYNGTRLTFYLAPGHTACGMIIVVWQLGLMIAGDYLSDIEFPFIRHSSVAYLETMDKMPRIHDRNWFTRMIPGHGSPTLNVSDWLTRREESLDYIYGIREHIVTGTPFHEEKLWEKYKFPRYQKQCHLDNIALMRKEFEAGLWTWDAE